MNIFNKAVVFTDAHFGRNGNSPVANKDNIDFLIWAIEEAKVWGAETCIVMGDWFENRHTIGVGSMHSALQGLELLSKAFKKTWFISGNHDQFFRDKRDITSIEFAKYIPNIVVINDPLTIEDVTFIPWLVGDEHKTLDLKSRYMFAHLELPGFLMNAKVEAPESSHAPSPTLFDSAEYVFTGHFHMRQFKKNICYTGNIMPFNFSDDGDSDRGAMFLEYGKEPFFRAWPDQPLYQSMKLSEMLADPDKLLKRNMTVRATVDVPLRYEEAQEIRDALVDSYGLRKLELANGIIEGEQEFDDKNVVFRTVDQIVIEGLASVESVELSSSRLVQIYTSLNS